MAQYYDTTKHPTSMPQPLTHPGRVDLARSKFISRLRENPQYVVADSWDTDVTPHNVRIEGMPPPMPHDRLRALVDEDVALGFDVVVGATLGNEGQAMIWASPEGWTSATSDAPFELIAFAGGFFSMTRKCALGLKVLERIKVGTGNVEMDAFCENSARGGEDITLSKNIRDSGFKICCDPRVTVSHNKEQRQVLDRSWYGEQRNAAIQFLRNRRKKLIEEEEAGAPGPLD